MHLGFHIYDVGFQSPNVEAARHGVYNGFAASYHAGVELDGYRRAEQAETPLCLMAF